METGEKGDSSLHLQSGGGEDSKLPKIVALSVNFPGAKRPLEEGAKLGFWDFILLGGGNIQIPPADIYILGAWHPVYENLLGLGSGSKLGVLWTSSAGEMDFEPVEQKYLRNILLDPRISFVWFGDLALSKVYPEKSFYAAYPLDVTALPPLAAKNDIATLFCPTGPKKNILNQLLAMRLVQRETKLMLHTNIQGYDLNNLDHVQHPWLPAEQYQALIASARVNLAVSWCETFNYNVAEAALLGTPSVTSLTVPFPGETVINPNNPEEIAEAILKACKRPADWSEYIRNEVVELSQERNSKLQADFDNLP